MSPEALVFGLIASAILIVGWLAWPKPDELDLAPRRSWSIGKLALGLSAITALGVGGYFGNRHLACQGLEDDYLNSVSQMKSTTALLAMYDKEDTRKAFTLIRDREMEKAETALLGLHQQCGSRAADTAVREGSELLLP